MKKTGLYGFTLFIAGIGVARAEKFELHRPATIQVSHEEGIDTALSDENLNKLSNAYNEHVEGLGVVESPSERGRALQEFAEKKIKTLKFEDQGPAYQHLIGNAAEGEGLTFLEQEFHKHQAQILAQHLKTAPEEARDFYRQGIRSSIAKADVGSDDAKSPAAYLAGQIAQQSTLLDLFTEANDDEEAKKHKMALNDLHKAAENEVNLRKDILDSMGKRDPIAARAAAANDYSEALQKLATPSSTAEAAQHLDAHLRAAASMDGLAFQTENETEAEEHRANAAVARDRATELIKQHWTIDAKLNARATRDLVGQYLGQRMSRFADERDKVPNKAASLKQELDSELSNLSQAHSAALMPRTQEEKKSQTPVSETIANVQTRYSEHSPTNQLKAAVMASDIDLLARDRVNAGVNAAAGVGGDKDGASEALRAAHAAEQQAKAANDEISQLNETVNTLSKQQRTQQLALGKAEKEKSPNTTSMKAEIARLGDEIAAAQQKVKTKTPAVVVNQIRSQNAKLAPAEAARKEAVDATAKQQQDELDAIAQRLPDGHIPEGYTQALMNHVLDSLIEKPKEREIDAHVDVTQVASELATKLASRREGGATQDDKLLTAFANMIGSVRNQLHSTRQTAAQAALAKNDDDGQSLMHDATQDYDKDLSDGSMVAAFRTYLSSQPNLEQETKEKLEEFINKLALKQKSSP